MVLGTAHLTALELAPQELVRQAARAGFGAVGLRLRPAMAGGTAYPLRAGTAALVELRRILHDEGVAVREVEFVEVVPEIDLPSLTPMLEAAAELGATSVTVSGDDPDPVRLAAHFAGLCDLALPFGLRIEVEFMRWRAVGTLSAAMALMDAAAAPNGGILVDALHLIRAGGGPDSLSAVPPAYLRSLQLCDAPLCPPPPEGIIAEARSGRLPPGQGGLPLAGILRAMPADTAVSAELPMAAHSPSERLALAFRATEAAIRAARSDAA